jgi:hypothetical protein
MALRKSIAEFVSNFMVQVWIAAVIDLILSVGVTVAAMFYKTQTHNWSITAIVACGLQVIKIIAAVTMLYFKNVQDNKNIDTLLKNQEDLRQEIHDMRQEMNDMRQETASKSASHEASLSNLHQAGASNAASHEASLSNLHQAGASNAASHEATMSNMFHTLSNMLTPFQHSNQHIGGGFR